MRHFLPALLLVTACGVAPAPEANPNDDLRRSLADAYSKINTIGQAVLVLQKENAALSLQVEALSSSVAQDSKDTRSSVVDLSEGTCISTRDHASGLPTGKRQHKPISWIVEPDSATPTTPTLAYADTDGDGEDDAIVLIADLDGDGKSEFISVGGDSDHDGSFHDDEAEADKRRSDAGDLVCGATDHF